MNGLAPSSSHRPRSPARLRLADRVLDAPAQPRRRERGPEPGDSGAALSNGHVLVVGADFGTRARMLSELRDVLPAGTRFLEARETWEVLARAADSQMVVLVGDLGELSSASLVRLLARRQPTLPVLAVGDTAAPAHPDVANM
jgi:hypothetical protein